MICTVWVGGASVCFPPSRRSLWANAGQISRVIAVSASAYLTFMRHAKLDRRLSESRLCLEVRRYGLVPMEAEIDIPFTSCDSHTCTRANKPIPHVSASSTVRGQSREKLFIRDTNWRVKNFDLNMWFRFQTYFKEIAINVYSMLRNGNSILSWEKRKNALRPDQLGRDKVIIPAGRDGFSDFQCLQGRRGFDRLNFWRLLYYHLLWSSELGLRVCTGRQVFIRPYCTSISSSVDVIGRKLSFCRMSIIWLVSLAVPVRCPMPDHPPCQIIPHPLAQSASALGSRKIFYDPLFSTLRLATLIEWETIIRQAGEAVFLFRKRRK